MASWYEWGILQNLKMRSSENHLKLQNLYCETFILITSVLRILRQIHSLQLTQWDLAIRKIWGQKLKSFLRYLFSKAKITRFEKTSFELTGRNAFQNKTSIPLDSNTGKNKKKFTEFQVELRLGRLKTVSCTGVRQWLGSGLVQWL